MSKQIVREWSDFIGLFTDHHYSGKMNLVRCVANSYTLSSRPRPEWLTKDLIDAFVEAYPPYGHLAYCEGAYADLYDEIFTDFINEKYSKWQR